MSNTTWLDNAVKNAPFPFVRDSALQIQQTGYLSLGDFFDCTSDQELLSVLHLLHDFSKQEQGTDSFVSSHNALVYLLVLIRIGAGIYTEKTADFNLHFNNFAEYVTLEVKSRRIMSDKQLRAQRLKYSIEDKPEGVVNNE